MDVVLLFSGLHELYNHKRDSIISKSFLKKCNSCGYRLRSFGFARPWDGNASLAHTNVEMLSQSDSTITSPCLQNSRPLSFQNPIGSFKVPLGTLRGVF